MESTSGNAGQPVRRVAVVVVVDVPTDDPAYGAWVARAAVRARLAGVQGPPRGEPYPITTWLRDETVAMTVTAVTDLDVAFRSGQLVADIPQPHQE